MPLVATTALQREKNLISLKFSVRAPHQVINGSPLTSGFQCFGHGFDLCCLEIGRNKDNIQARDN